MPLTARYVDHVAINLCRMRAPVKGAKAALVREDDGESDVFLVRSHIYSGKEEAIAFLLLTAAYRKGSIIREK